MTTICRKPAQQSARTLLCALALLSLLVTSRTQAQLRSAGESRTGKRVFGAAVGMVLGGIAGICAYGQGCTSTSGQAGFAAFNGLLVGSAIGSSLFPAPNRDCAFAGRVARGFVGALAGFGVTLGRATTTGGVGIFTLPIAIPVGSARAQRRC